MDGVKNGDERRRLRYNDGDEKMIRRRKRRVKVKKMMRGCRISEGLIYPLPDKITGDATEIPAN